MRSVVLSLPAIDRGQNGLPCRAKVADEALQIDLVSDPLCVSRAEGGSEGR